MPVKNSRNRRSRAFTLLELLAVCAVVAVLASLLVPLLARGTMQARQAACLANQRQMGLALLQYAGDHDNCLPQTTHTTGRRRIEESWIYTLSSYLGDIDKVRVCPADSPARRSTILRLKATSYVLNDLVFDDAVYYRLTALPFPAKTLLVAILTENRTPSATWDHIHGGDWTSWHAALADIEPDRHRTGARAADRLNGSANYLFADGHAETISAKDFRGFFERGINPAQVPTETSIR